MSMWYEFDGVLILKFSVSPAFTLIDVAKPWIVESPIPFTCQSLTGSPGSWFSHAIVLAQAAAAGRAPTTESKLSSIASVRPMANLRAAIPDARNPVTDISVPHGRCHDLCL